MPECRYCGETFDSADAHLTHLEETHADELSRIDQRRIEQQTGDGATSRPVIYGVIVAVIVLAVAGYVVFGPGGGGSASEPDEPSLLTPQAVGSVHAHGTINMTVDGERIDFTQTKYKQPRENPAFHFEGTNDPRWHVHAQDVTVFYAMATLDIKVIPGEVIFDGVVYREQDPGITIRIAVNGKSVDPREYVLTDGDHIHIVVTVN